MPHQETGQTIGTVPRAEVTDRDDRAPGNNRSAKARASLERFVKVKLHPELSDKLGLIDCQDG